MRAENFSLSFAIPAAYQNFDSLVITLSDSVRADITFDLELRKITTGVVDPDTKTFVDYNGIRYAMNGRFNKWVTQNGMLTESNSVTPMRITYHDGIVGDADGDVLTVTHNTNGTAFYGFPSGKVYVDFTFRDVDGSTARRRRVRHFYGRGHHDCRPCQPVVLRELLDERRKCRRSAGFL